MTNTAIATPPKPSLVAKFAARYSIDQDKLLPILKATAFKVKNGEVTNEQMAALLIVADQYGLNPFTREIFAFPDKKNGIVPVVGVDGWSRIINDHEQADGFDFRQSDEMVTMPDAQPCPKWMEVVIYRKDRTHPIIVREYLDEVYRPLGQYDDGNKMKPGPWQTHTKRFLRHKTLIQGARIAYGFSGIYDEDEANRIIEMGEADVVNQTPTVVQMPKAKSEKKPEDVTDVPLEQPPAVEKKPGAVVTPSPDGKADALIMASPLGLLRKKLEHAALTEHEACKRFNVGKLEDLRMSQVSDVFAWVSNPTEG